MEEKARSAPSPAPSTSPSMLAIRDLQLSTTNLQAQINEQIQAEVLAQIKAANLKLPAEQPKLASAPSAQSDSPSMTAIKEMRQSVQGKIEAEVQKQLTLRQAATNPSAGQADPAPSPAVPVSTAPPVPLVSEAMPPPISAAPPATTGTTRQLGSVKPASPLAPHTPRAIAPAVPSAAARSTPPTPPPTARAAPMSQSNGAIKIAPAPTLPPPPEEQQEREAIINAAATQHNSAAMGISKAMTKQDGDGQAPKGSIFSAEAFRTHRTANPHPDRMVYVYNAHCFCANNQQAFFLNETFKSNVAARFAQHEGVQVGPLFKEQHGHHSLPQFKIAFTRDMMADVVSWLSFYRPAMINVLIRPVTAQPVLDYTERALWLGDRAHLSMDTIKMKGQAFEEGLRYKSEDGVLADSASV